MVGRRRSGCVGQRLEVLASQGLGFGPRCCRSIHHNEGGSHGLPPPSHRHGYAYGHPGCCAHHDGGWMAEGTYANSPSIVTMKSMFPKAHVRAWDPTNAVTSHLKSDVDVETRKKPLTGVPIVDVFGPPMSKFVFARLARMVCSEDTRVYTGSGRTSLRPVHCC